MHRAFRTLALPALVAATLGGCGGGDDNSDDAAAKPNAVEEQVSRNARTVITDAQESCKLLTDQALAVFTGNQAKNPLNACHRQAERGRLPKEARIKVFDVEGDTARVGYVTSQVTGIMIFIKQDGEWLMDAVTTIPN